MASVRASLTRPPSLSYKPQVAILHFLSQSFRLYVRITAVNNIFNVAVQNLRGWFLRLLATIYDLR